MDFSYYNDGGEDEVLQKGVWSQWFLHKKNSLIVCYYDQCMFKGV